MANFEDILNQTVDEVKNPPTMPVGTYIWSVAGPPKGVKAKTGTDGLEFTCNCISAMDDVDEDALAEFGNVQGKTNRITFWLTEESVFMLDRFLFEHLGLELGMSRKQAIAEAVNRQFAGTIRHTPSPDGTRIYANIGNTAAV